MARGYNPLSTEDWNKLMRANVVARVFPKGMAVPGLGGQDFNGGETPIPSPTPTPSITPTQTITPTPTLTPTPTPSSLPPASISYITKTGTSVNDTTIPYEYSFNGVDIGGPGLIVLSIGTYVDAITPTTTISGITIGGVSATFQTLGHSGNFVFHQQTLAYARITGGTTADIVIQYNTANGFPANCQVGVWRIQNNTSDTPYQVKTNLSTQNTQSITFTSLPTNSVGVVGIALYYQTNGPSWTNATSRYADVVELAKYSGGDFTSVAGGDLTITNTYSSVSGIEIKTLGMAWS